MSFCEAPNMADDKLAAGLAHILVALLLALRVMAAALMVLLWDSSLFGMTQHRVSMMMMMIKVASGAAMDLAVALPRRDHGLQHLPQPIICSL